MSRKFVTLNVEIVLDVPHDFDTDSEEGQKLLREEFIDYLQSCEHINLDFQVGEVDDSCNYIADLIIEGSFRDTTIFDADSEEEAHKTALEIYRKELKEGKMDDLNIFEITPEMVVVRKG